MYGANTQELRDLAASFSNAAQSLQETSRSLSSTVASTLWRGSDADQFKSRWTSLHRSRMESAAAAIDEAATTLRRNADDQDRASGVEPEGAAGPLKSLLPEDVRGFVHDHSPSEVRDWWASLTPEQRQHLLDTDPELIGNTDGLPPEIRYQANRVRLQVHVESLKQERERLSEMVDNPLQWVGEALDEQIGKFESLASEGRQILLFDPSGDGRIAEVFGDLSKADDVAIVVPGVSNDLGKYGSDRDDIDAHRLYQAAGGENGELATIQWLGYDTPQGVDDPAALSEVRARAEAHQLVEFTEGLKATVGGEIGVAAHSYGTVLTTEAAKQGMTVDRVLLLGSPGVWAEDASVFNGADVFAGSNPNDPIQHVDLVTPASDPTAHDFGAKELPTNPDDPVQRAHSTYFDNGSRSLNGMVEAIQSDRVVDEDALIATRTIGPDGISDSMDEGELRARRRVEDDGTVIVTTTPSY